VTDALTGLDSRSHFLDQAERVLPGTSAAGAPR